MANLLQDISRHEVFRSMVPEPNTSPSADSYALETIEWRKDLNTNTTTGLSVVSSTVSQLACRRKVDLRIIFAPLDYPTRETLNVLLELFRAFSIPSDFIVERVQSVTHSFGCTSNKEGGHSSWFHFLCKNIDSQHDNFLWIRSGYFLSSDAQHQTTLICFGASTALQKRLKSVTSHGWCDVLQEPFGLLPIVLSDLHLQLDEQVWAIARPVGVLERHAIQSTYKAENFRQDFIALHHIAKNIIHLKEASDAVLKTISHMIRHHAESCQVDRPNHCSTSAALDYQQTLFESVNLRLMSLEKRMQNVINLSFNLVAQKDSNVILQESSSMHTIAFTTLIFLPISTVATIFGSQFFNYSPSQQSNQIHLSPSFWIFWIITVPLTFLVLSVWLYFHPNTLSRWVGLRKEPIGVSGTKTGDLMEMVDTSREQGNKRKTGKRWFGARFTSRGKSSRREGQEDGVYELRPVSQAPELSSFGAWRGRESGGEC